MGARRHAVGHEYRARASIVEVHVRVFVQTALLEFSCRVDIVRLPALAEMRATVKLLTRQDSQILAYDRISSDRPGTVSLGRVVFVFAGFAHLRLCAACGLAN